MSRERFFELRENHKTFEYKSFDACVDQNLLKVAYHFSISGLTDFTSKWEFPISADTCPDEASRDCLKKALENVGNGTDTVLNRMLFSLGMVETISYYKITCPKQVVISCGTLSEAQMKWWRKLYHNGLGEFLFLNGVDDVAEEDLVSFVCRAGNDLPLHDPASYEGALVPVGGGKDSVVSLEVLKGQPIVTYSVNGNATTQNVIDVCNHKQGDYRAKRILDKQIIELNQKGYLNGHIPFSAVVAFSTVISSFLSGKKYICLSNETSANESTVKDSFVNHQYSKSFEFERDFGWYFSTLTDSDIHYFSLLRPLTELQIAFLFSRFTEYHKVFRSCNRGSKQGIWCCDCPKCLFVYIILTPFLTREELHQIFGEDLLDKESLDLDFRELCGIEENKPFECVGTRREVLACMKAYIDRGGHSLLTDRYGQILSTVPYRLEEMLMEWVPEHGVFPDYEHLLKEKLQHERNR